MLRACVYIRGSTTQLIYGKDKARLVRRAIKLLTVFAPGTGSLWPDRIEVQTKIGEVSGNQSLWETTETIRYEDLTNEQHEWRKRP